MLIIKRRILVSTKSTNPKSKQQNPQNPQSSPSPPPKNNFSSPQLLSIANHARFHRHANIDFPKLGGHTTDIKTSNFYHQPSVCATITIHSPSSATQASLQSCSIHRGCEGELLLLRFPGTPALTHQPQQSSQAWSMHLVLSHAPVHFWLRPLNAEESSSLTSRVNPSDNCFWLGGLRFYVNLFMAIN